MIYLDTSAALNLVMPRGRDGRAGTIDRAAAQRGQDRVLCGLDAIHLATAHELRAELIAFVCYDQRLHDSAHALGLPVEAFA